ncbi:MAG TPA: hypothetical protein VFY79_09625 [Dehalococcoidia bacterium]|jgi:hypothetical protein|nr:hypothetical protein [Dehalococcoidia bacterium]
MRRNAEQPDVDRMARISGRLVSKADKIRALGAAGYSRTEIAEFLGIRYQHVRNVLVHEDRRLAGSASRAPLTSFGRARLGEQGELLLPADLISRLGVRPGGVVPWRFEDGQVVLMSAHAGLRYAQQIAGRYGPLQGESMTDSFLRERRAEAERELREDAGG